MCNLLVQLDKLLALLPLLFFLFYDLLEFTNFLLGEGKFGLELPRQSVDVAVEDFDTCVA